LLAHFSGITIHCHQPKDLLVLLVCHYQLYHFLRPAYSIDFLNWIDSLLQVRFWFALWFTNRYDKIDIETLELVKNNMDGKNWFYRKAVKILIKRAGGI